MPINSFLYPGAKVVQPYEVSNSLRFESSSTDGLSQTFSSAGNRKTFTFSTWIKRSNLSDTIGIFEGFSSSTVRTLLYFDTSDKFHLYDAATNKAWTTNAVFRDVSAWYHIVVAVDTTQATSTNRVHIYVNGSEVSYSTYDTIAQNTDFQICNSVTHYVGRRGSGSEFDGYLCETVLIDGSQLDPTSFGEFDEDTGIWKPIDVSGLTFGTNGFYLDFKDSSALGNDVSGNNNDFTVNNLTSIDQTTDTPTNNYATLNPLAGTTAITFSEGNCKAVFAAQSSRDICQSAFGVSSGKWYWEVKVNNTYGRAGGITSLSDDTQSNNVGGSSFSWGYFGNDGTVFNNNASIGVSYATYSSNIISTFLDLDNNKLYFAKDGTLQSSTGIDITDPASIGDNFYFPAVSNGESSVSPTFEVNFGNPTFSITSSNSDPNGYGNFEYSTTITGDGVSKDFYALNTKNLAEYG